MQHPVDVTNLGANGFDPLPFAACLDRVTASLMAGQFDRLLIEAITQLFSLLGKQGVEDMRLLDVGLTVRRTRDDSSPNCHAGNVTHPWTERQESKKLVRVPKSVRS